MGSIGSDRSYDCGMAESQSPIAANRSISDLESDEPGYRSPATSDQWRLLLVFLCAMSIGMVTRFPYFFLYFAKDDYDFLYQIGLARAGKMPYWVVWLAPQGPHPMFAWKALFNAELSLFGLEPWGWHLVTLVIHSVGAVALFGLLRRYLTSEIGAWLGSLLWAGAAIGNWDNPHAWIMCGMIPLATMWILIAMNLVPRIDRPGSGWLPWILSFVLAAALLSWGDALAFFVVLALQFWMLEVGRKRWLPSGRWLLAVLLPTLLIGAIQVAIILPQLNEADRQRDRDPVEIAYRTMGQMGVSLATLLYDPSEPMRPDHVTLKIAFAIGVMGTAILLRGHTRRLVLLFLFWGLLYALMTNVGGANLDRDAAVHAGHYLYLPTLAWCVLAAGLASALASRWPKQALAGTMLLLGLFTVHQYRVAAATSAFAAKLFEPSTQNFLANQEVLRELTRLAAARGRGVRLPEFPVPIKAETSFGFWPVSSLAAITELPHRDAMTIVPLDQVSADDVREVGHLLASIQNPVAAVWVDRIEKTWQYARGLLWLDEFAASRGEPIQLPDFWISEGALQTKVAPFLYFGFTKPPEHVMASGSAAQRQQLEALITELQRSPDPAAATWIQLLSEMKEDLP